MKRVFTHPQEAGTGPKYWRSLGQLTESAEYKGWLEREFPAHASELAGETSRRGFLKYMGASAALAGLSLSACRREEKELVPFSQGVEWSVPGKALFYATSRPTRRGAHPLVIATYDGRPTKVEGNPKHPASKGATDIHSQASILDLYDPDRSKAFLQKGVKTTEAAFEEYLKGVVAHAGDGTGLAFLTERSNSPTVDRVTDALKQKFPKALWSVYEPLGGSEARTAQDTVFGKGQRAVPQLAAADVILSLDCDFLGFDEGSVEGIRAFADRRKPEQKMNRLYVVENRYTTTGGMADHRRRCPVSKIGAFAYELATKIAAIKSDAGLQSVLAQFPKQSFTAGHETPKWIEEAAADLAKQENAGKALVLVGYRQPAAVQALVYAINNALGALGSTLVGRASTHVPAKGIADLAKAIEAKQVKTLFVLGGNPVYNAPADLNWTALQKTVETVRLGYYVDETSEQIVVGHDKDGKPTFDHNPVLWQVPAAHYLETWGDGLASDGSYVPVQPMILPIYGSRRQGEARRRWHRSCVCRRSERGRRSFRQ
jgi:molybdopterin-containing oxidoreductase family iron-sulfur binding subunit